jgi:hypothetical protein
MKNSLRMGTAVFLTRPQYLVGRGRRATRAGWNDPYFVPLLLTVACASLPPVCSLLSTG